MTHPPGLFVRKAALTFEEVKKSKKSHSMSQTQQDWHASGSKRYTQKSVFAERVVEAHDISSEKRSGWENKHMRGVCRCIVEMEMALEVSVMKRDDSRRRSVRREIAVKEASHSISQTTTVWHASGLCAIHADICPCCARGRSARRRLEDRDLGIGTST